MSGQSGSINPIASILLYSGFVLGAFITFKGYQWFRLKRIIENMPKSKIRSIAMGLVEIYGKVKPYGDNVLISPIGKQNCIYYASMIDRLIKIRERGRIREEWRSAYVKMKMVPYFKIYDETGEVLVKTEGSKGLMRTIKLNPSDYKEGLNLEAVKKIIEDDNEMPKVMKILMAGADGTDKFRYYEIAVKPEDNLYVIGDAGRNPFVESGAAQKSEEAIMISKGKHENIFYISEKDEAGVIKKLKRDSLLGISIGVIVMVISLTIILIKLGLF
ncbi:MAG: hypothetical protein NT001_07330 [Candidatus Woesearchaeota archaeon]|nr:hypothetical protein [Candidatus Woesearchaeota archaeon]